MCLTSARQYANDVDELENKLFNYKCQLSSEIEFIKFFNSTVAKENSLISTDWNTLLVNENEYFYEN